MTKGSPQNCAYPGCANTGIFRAPVHPERLEECYFFCRDHVRAYNVLWNKRFGSSGEDLERPDTSSAPNKGINSMDEMEARVKHSIRSANFDYDKTGLPSSKRDFAFLERGVRRGLECRAAAISKLEELSLSMVNPRLVDEGPDELAESIAEKRGYLDVGSDRGMSGTVDGAHYDFDQLRACFILGVREGLSGVSVEECVEHYARQVKQ